MKVKAKEIANILGVSEATVSLALNGRPGVSERTRQRILKCADDMRGDSKHMVPGSVFETKKSIKVIMYISGIGYYDDITNNLFSISYLTIFQMANEREMDVKLIYVNDEDDVQRLLQESEQDGVAGIVLFAASMPPATFDKYRHCKLPIVVYDADFAESPFDVILIDNRQAVYNCMRHLQRMGHEDIMFFENGDVMYNFESRKRAFLRYCQQGKLPLGEENCFKTGVTIEEVYQNVMKYIRNGRHIPTAVLAQNYSVSVGTIRALKDSGYRIPEDVSILGIDELPAAVLLDFKFTHSKINHREKTRRMMNCLFERIDGIAQERVKMYIGTEFIVGDSVRNLKNKEIY